MKNMRAEELIAYLETEVAELIEQFVEDRLESTNIVLGESSLIVVRLYQVPDLML